MLNLARIAFFSAMTFEECRNRVPPLNVIPAQAGTHASLRKRFW
jgi:hypothetical protein